jgi:hypothetical protein
MLHLNLVEAGRLTIGRIAEKLAVKALRKSDLDLRGRFVVRCRDARGRLIWREEFPNTVVTVGKNILLNTLMAGSSYSVTGPYMGLITNTSFSAIAAGDTMSSHAGWLESSDYGSTRPTCAWSSASGGSISLSAALAFTMTGSETLYGAFIVLGSGASATVANTSGTLFSAGEFTGGTQAVSNTQVVDVSYTLSV